MAMAMVMPWCLSVCPSCCVLCLCFTLSVWLYPHTPTVLLLLPRMSIISSLLLLLRSKGNGGKGRKGPKLIRAVKLSHRLRTGINSFRLGFL
ncbi:uncharacterized protein J3D65DRAFT_612136 [Phyllosticta citribraziliensis]|uniref:Secreted protein n=1 Tax=Phyllosticta citribraziliensis TaxID=989973 RepID=A0ABR1M2Z6_9PEZI